MWGIGSSTKPGPGHVAQLAYLPTETLNHICSFLCGHCLESDAVWHSHSRSPDGIEPWERPKILAHLSQTLRRLYSIALPYLYHSIRWSHYGLTASVCLVDTLLSKLGLPNRNRLPYYCLKKLIDRKQT